MKTVFYLGALSLVYQSSWPLKLGAFDSRFLVPVLPVTAEYEIQLQTAASLPPEPTNVVARNAMRTWRDNDDFVRLYDTDVETAPYLMSRKNGRQVEIIACEEPWRRRAGEFSPWFYIHIEELLLQNRALILHSASIIYRGKAIIFTAPSGTGKTTQTDLWERYRDGVTHLNGDRTLLQHTLDGWYACGFPIYGGSVRCVQAAVPIHAIVVIRQSPVDQIRALSPLEKVSLLYSEITVPTMDRAVVESAMDLIQLAAEEIPVVQLDCTMNETAVEALHRRLFGE